MSVYNFTNASIAGVSPSDKKQHRTTPRGFEPFILRNVFDTAFQNIANDGSSAGVLYIPKGITVLACFLRIITVDAGGGTLSLGVTTTDATKWGNAIPLSALGVPEVTGGPVFNPLYFGTADYIDILEDAAAAITTLKAEVIAVCVDSNSTIDADEQIIAGYAV
jgi:hypothetical protein